MEVIVPAAGRSSRFPNMKPKYLLYDYKGDLMLKNAVGAYDNVTVGILKEHDELYDASNHIKLAIPHAKIIILDEITSGPAVTVYEILRKANISEGPILIHDCDSFFTHAIPDQNYVCVTSIHEHDVLKKLQSKSFVRYNENEMVIDIIEKQIVSDTFCVGGYFFQNASDFLQSFLDLYGIIKGELYVSHVIQDCLERGVPFSVNRVKNLIDVGTADNWFEYNDKPVIFCDVDGTLIKAQPRTEYDKKPVILIKNVERIKEYARNGSQIVFTTSRPHDAGEWTEQLLKSLGFDNFILIVGLNNSRRILINDFNSHAPFPRAIAINIERDTDTLDLFV